MVLQNIDYPNVNTIPYMRWWEMSLLTSLPLNNMFLRLKEPYSKTKKEPDAFLRPCL